jgi:acyl-CoA synthetase (AMP-forming)/AMP-acid ligase II
VIWRSSHPDVPVGGSTLPGLIGHGIERHPSRTALVDGASGGSASYEELGARIDRISAWLAHHGVAAGDTVALWAPNTPPWAACALAAMRLGAAVTAVNPAWTVREAAAQLTDAGASLVVTAPGLAEAAAGIDGVRHIVVLGPAGPGTALSQVLACRYPTPPAATDPSALAFLPYSSGTTGLPKGVRLTHANLVTSVRQAQAFVRFSERDTVLAVAPFFHVLGAVVTLAMPLAAGAKVVTVPRFEPDAVLALIEEHRITVLAVPPPIAAFLARHPAVAGRDLSSLELVAVGGAPLPESVHRALAARLPGCVVAQGWGLTETTASVCVPDRLRPSPPGTVGRLIPNTELMVVDLDTGVAVGAGAPGELWVRGPQVMAGYLNRPAATAEVLDPQGWLRTGDLGMIDVEGNVTVLDRLKELIKVDGYQVAPAEVEALLLTHPAVSDAAVVGRADDRHGEVPVAYVIAAGPLDIESLHHWLAARLAAYKCPVEVVTVDHLPRTPSGKLLRRTLRAAELTAGPGQRR